MDELQAVFAEARENGASTEPIDEAYALLHPVIARLQEATTEAGEGGRHSMRWAIDEKWSDAVNLLAELGELRRDIRAGRFA